MVPIVLGAAAAAPVSNSSDAFPHDRSASFSMGSKTSRANILDSSSSSSSSSSTGSLSTIAAATTSVLTTGDSNSSSSSSSSSSSGGGGGSNYFYYSTDGHLVEFPPGPRPVTADGSDEGKSTSKSSGDSGRQYVQEEEEEEKEEEEVEETEEEKRRRGIDDARLPLKKRRCHVETKFDDVVAASALLGLKMQG